MNNIEIIGVGISESECEVIKSAIVKGMNPSCTYEIEVDFTDPEYGSCTICDTYLTKTKPTKTQAEEIFMAIYGPLIKIDNRKLSIVDAATLDVIEEDIEFAKQ